MSRICIGGVGVTHRDITISAVRAIAFLSIILCHIFQFYSIELAWWFNVGVQVFLCMSGFLYGKKGCADVLEFYRKQIKKILVPYYVLILLMITAQLCFVKEQITVIRIANVLLCHGTLFGGEHLWFIPTILFCYTLFPLMSLFNDRIWEMKEIKKKVCYFSSVFVALGILIRLFVPYFNSAWIACFYLGTVLGRIDDDIKLKITLISLIPVTFAFIGTQIVIDYVLHISMSGNLEVIYKMFCDFGHTFLGTTIMLSLMSMLKGLAFPVVLKRTISFLDTISYEGYLVHQFCILGPFSVLKKI